ncbi:hypothetical protein M422DRAFT_774309 [Sphaerobolus stellatus SS14]|nr:hypothetical protein M422DRAFT_774309 [Sphaerobolus stellatus SS14]
MTLSDTVVAVDKHVPLTPTREMLATLGVSPQQFERRQEQLRRSFSTASPAPLSSYPHPTLPFPLNLPPSYAFYPTTSAAVASARPQRPTPSSQGASSSPSPVPDASFTDKHDIKRAVTPHGASSATGKAKPVPLDVFVDSRAASRLREIESSSSDSDTSLHKMLVIPKVEPSQNGVPSAPLSSSPPSSSPLHTPRPSSPMPSSRPFPSSPTPRPKRQTALSTTASDLPYTLPSGPYSEEKPSWSLAALIGQAINASHAAALPLNDIYNYVSTVYPHFDRRDQAWMSSVRHSLSVNEAFERVPDQDGNVVKKGKGKTRSKGGLWRIKPGFEECFVNGNFVRKGAKGAGPGMNPNTRKRPREEEEQSNEKKSKPTASTHSRAVSQVATSSSSRIFPQMHLRSYSSPSPGPSRLPPPPPPSSSSPPPLTASQSTAPSSSSPLAPPPLLPSMSLVATPERPFTYKPASSLEPGFQFDTPTKSQHPSETLFNRPTQIDPTLLTSDLPQTAEPTKLPRFNLPARPSTPPSRSPNSGLLLSPERTPISHRGLQMSPSRSLAHYKTSLVPEWKVGRPSTPPSAAGPSSSSSLLALPHTPHDPSIFLTPKRSIFPSRGFDPYDPNAVLAEEIAGLRRDNLDESPGGFFGKEGRKLLYESPSAPGKSDWRFRDLI